MNKHVQAIYRQHGHALCQTRVLVELVKGHVLVTTPATAAGFCAETVGSGVYSTDNLVKAETVLLFTLLRPLVSGYSKSFFEPKLVRTVYTG